MQQGILVRHAARSDLDAICALEQLCFPAAEAADREAFTLRLNRFPACFWVAECGGQIIGMINGMTAHQSDLTDAMYESDACYAADGAWLMLFGVETHPEFQHRGIASRLMAHVIEETKRQSRNGIVLTCKEALIPFYQRFGFVSEGISTSVHGGAVWYQMRISFREELFRCARKGEECSFYIDGRRYLLYGWQQCDGVFLNVEDAAGSTVWQTTAPTQAACGEHFVRAYLADAFW